MNIYFAIGMVATYFALWAIKLPERLKEAEAVCTVLLGALLTALLTKLFFDLSFTAGFIASIVCLILSGIIIYLIIPDKVKDTIRKVLEVTWKILKVLPFVVAFLGLLYIFFYSAA